MTSRPESAASERAAQIAEQIHKRVARIADVRLKRRLLAAGCDMADAALKLHTPPTAA